VLWRHLTGARGQARGSLAADLGDSIFLAVLLIGLGTGLFTAALYRWASSWGAVTLTPYVTSLLRGDPMSALAAQMPFLVQLHVFSAFALLAALPFTRVAVFFIAAIEGAAGLLGRPIAAANRGAEGWLRKHNPAVWIWPEED
jgi:nitrate reductase gamma subunit